MDDIQTLKEKGLDYLLYYYNELNESEKQSLLDDIKKVDFDYMKTLAKSKNSIDKNEVVKPLKGAKKEDFSESDVVALSSLGKDVITSGKYAIVTLAGGQGTRLGHSGPKGTYKLQFLDRPRYIFEIFVENLLKAKDKYGVYIPWYIMTSIDNNDKTVEFFEANNYFGYPKDKVKFFSQGVLPITDLDGNVVLENKSKVFMAGDGNGGVFKAMSKSNIIDEMKSIGIEWVLITGVDNILVNLCDEFFIGLTKSENKFNGVKSIAKRSPDEKVGVFCRRNEKPSVIEYSEMTDEMKEAKDDKGELKYIEANIVNHLFSIKLLEKIQNEPLPIHKAIKKLNYINKEGAFVEPTTPCLIKYEAFIFDYFKMVDDVTIYRVKREEEFAPVKNKEGNDSPETAIKLYNDLYLKNKRCTYGKVRGYKKKT